MDKNKNVIGVGFLYYYPKEIKNKKFQIDNNETLELYKKIFDVNLLIDEGYDYPYELLNIFKIEYLFLQKFISKLFFVILKKPQRQKFFKKLIIFSLK